MFIATGALPREALQRWLGWDKVPAERLAQVAELLGARTTVSGEPLPARFPAVAAAFHDGRLNLAQVEAILLEFDTAAGRRAEKDLQINFARAEDDFVADAQLYRMGPNALRKRAREYIELLDQDGAGQAKRNPQVNQLRLYRKRDGSGGKMIGDLNTANFSTIATSVAALAVKLPGDTRDLPRRQVDALGELASFALRHNAELPDIGGEVPQILRKIPKHLRRAIAIRDRGCALPGCTRNPPTAKFTT